MSAIQESALNTLLTPKESALDLFTRCKSEPLACSIPGIPSLRPGEPLEIVGSSPTGKTSLALHITLHCILPKWCGGEAKKALYFDNDFHLDLKRIVSLISYQYRKHEQTADNQDSLEVVLKETLDRLVIFRCNDHFQFYQTIKDINLMLRGYSGRDSPYKLLVVDSISSFYWTQRTEETVGINSKQLACALVDVISHGRVVCVFVGWKGGKDSIHFQSSARITLDFVRFRELELISQVTLSSEAAPYFLHVSSHGCSFSSDV